MRSIIMYLEAVLPEKELPPKLTPQLPAKLSPYMLSYMKKDPEFAAQVTANLKNYENVAKMRSRHLIKL